MFYNLKWYKNKLGLQYLTILKIYNNKSKNAISNGNLFDRLLLTNTDSLVFSHHNIISQSFTEYEKNTLFL